MQTLVIDRNIWGRGGGSGRGRLLNPITERMCCLGIYIQSFGIDKKYLHDKESPTNLDRACVKELRKKAPWMFLRDAFRRNVTSDLAAEMMAVNDDHHYEEDEREEEIKSLFYQAGVEVTFIN